jgi:O-antigen biosynthesis protein WbqP
MNSTNFTPNESNQLSTQEIPKDEACAAEGKPGKGYLFAKRCFDFCVALIASLVLLIPMLIIGLLIRLSSPGPAVFKQKRMGQGGKEFIIYKFRTMRTDAPSEMAARHFEDSHKFVTKIGAFLRRTSLDELPQLLNILRGNMSFVGYRPVCLTETKLNDLRKEYGVFSAKPGLTGLAQVSGRDNISSSQKAAIDAEYVRNCSMKLDLWCIWKTVAIVFSGEGVL